MENKYCSYCKKNKQYSEFGEFKTCNDCRALAKHRYTTYAATKSRLGREQYHADIQKSREQVRIKHRRRATRVEIGLLIKSEVMNEPKSDNKNLWNGRGRWHPEYDRCIECTTNVYKHKGNGVCYKCYRRLWYENNRQQEIDAAVMRKRSNKDKVNEARRARGKLAKKYIDAATNGEINKTPTIHNLLMNLPN